MKKVLRNSNGFTLIEVVIALGVLGFGILTMFSMQAFGVRGNRIANTLSREVAMGVNALELSLAKGYEDKGTGSTAKTLQDKTYMEGLLKNSVDTSAFVLEYKAPVVDDPAEGLMTIEVELTSNIDNRKVSMKYVKANMDAL